MPIFLLKREGHEKEIKDFDKKWIALGLNKASDGFLLYG
jgi:hypothetical protein